MCLFYIYIHKIVYIFVLNFTGGTISLYISVLQFAPYYLFGPLHIKWGNSTFYFILLGQKNENNYFK